MAKHRTKKEIAAEKLAKDVRRAERLAKRATKNKALAVKRKAKVTAQARRDALSRSIANRDAAKDAAYKAEIAAIQFEMKARTSKLRDLERWQTSVMYLCGFTVDEINKSIGANARRGPINRVVTAGKLEAIRKSSQRLRKLADLASKPPHGMEGFAEFWASRSPTNRGLHRDLKALMEIKPEFHPMTQKLRGGGERIWNPNASALHAEASAGGIAEYCLQAGVWLSSLFDRIGAGGVRGFDPTRDQVDGGGQGGGAESSVDALKIETMVRDHVLAAFRPDGTAEWRWRVLDHVIRLDLPLAHLSLPAGLGSPSRFLNEALEEVAICRNMAPSGIRSRRPGGALDEAYAQATANLRRAVQEHHRLRRTDERDATPPGG